MIRVLQFGEGNFLRTFVDAYFDILNQEGGRYAVDIVKPIPLGNLDAFRRQDNRYHIVLRGIENGKPVERVHPIGVVDRVIDPFEQTETFFRLAEDPELTIIVSNTTEAGITYCAEDRQDDLAGMTYPAKLTQLLYRRFTAGLPGVYLLPVELIENNADELYRCVDRYITLWGLTEAFREWNNTQCVYCNTLVDRIVSGYPRDTDTAAHLRDLIGEDDALMSVGEPFGLWVVENKGDIARYLPDGTHNIEVILTDDIGYYKKRKVRVLNGSHTNLVAAGLWLGCQTVYDCMEHPRLSAFLDNTLQEEIIPYVSADTAATATFAEDVKERFRNPYLNHQLTGIALNSISKWRARDLCSFADHYRQNGRIPTHLTVGFSYLMALYSRVRATDDGFVAVLPGRQIALQDEAAYLRYFAEGGSVTGFMQKADVFGEDLTVYKDFAQTVEQQVAAILDGEVLV